MFEQLIKELDICVPKKPRSEWGKCQRRIVDRAISAIKNPYDGMTNGEVIQAIYGVMVLNIKDGKVWVEKIYFPFDLEWWNAPYKAESEDK